MDGPPVPDAGFVVQGGRFVRVGPAAELFGTERPPVTDLGPTVVLPGLINAHCHLDYTLMRGAILPSRSFSHWVARINALKGALSDDDYVRSIELGLAELVAHGTTTVLNIAAIPQVFSRLSAPPIRVHHFLELIDVRPRRWEDAYAFGAWLVFADPPSPQVVFGLSPHAPYTASPELYRLARDCGERFGLPLTTHVAESDEEWAMFADAAGPLHRFLSTLGRPMADCGGTTPLQALLNPSLVGPRTILVHLNRLNEADLAVLARPEWSGLTVVHCPKSHRFLHHHPFPLAALQACGLNVALGTDSLASNDSLNLFAEMRTLRRTFPGVTAEAALRMATVHGARALGREGELGRIAPGCLADAIAVPVPEESLASPYEIVLENRSRVPWMLVNGRPLPTSA